MSILFMPDGDIHEFLDYSAVTGVFVWKAIPSNAVRIGERAGKVIPKGHRVISFRGESYMEHWLAWFFAYGDWPSQQIDHINRDPGDNRIVNLRLASHAENMRNRKGNANSSSRYKGVAKCPRTKTPTWTVNIGGREERRYIGRFTNEEDAARVYDALAREKFGEFAYLNFPQQSGT